MLQALVEILGMVISTANMLLIVWFTGDKPRALQPARVPVHRLLVLRRHAAGGPSR